MGIVAREGGWPVLDTDTPNTFFCQPLKLPPGSRVTLAHIYLPAVEGLINHYQISWVNKSLSNFMKTGYKRQRY